ncbi:MAG: UDP-glucose 4-epimerase, partial [Pseudonocardiales bacterium]|nr:UDP-glucose 4-epimerase [Pseudonocardiales bacterium]
MTKRVLVTGGAGFVGANLVRVLGDGGWTIRVLDDFRTGREEYVADLGVEVVRGEIGDLPLVTDLAAGVDAI